MNAVAHCVPSDPQSPFDPAELRKVALVVSASRGGSSALAEWLRTKNGLISLDGELRPLLRLSGIDDDHSDSDCIGEVEPERIHLLRRLIAGALGAPADSGLPFDAEDMIARSSKTIALQWPGLLDEGRVEDIVRNSLSRIGWSSAADYDSCRLMVEIIRDLRALDASICPYRYDLPSRLVTTHFPDARRPDGPIERRAHEETPFVLPRLTRPLSRWDIASGTVVIKDPGNAFRARLLRQIFPKAEFRVIHLVRNPAASINGLIDGWNHWNFFSRRLPGQLSIRGYSDRFPWGRDWWKFDLPPGWREYRDAPLGHVCGFQWGAVHRAIIDEFSGMGRSYIRIKFEDFIDQTHRGSALRLQLADWLGIHCPEDQLAPPREVMVTHPPKPARWRTRAAEIHEYVEFSRRILDARELGYGGADSEWT